MNTWFRGRRRALATVLSAVVVGSGVAALVINPAEADHQPADKVVAAGSNVEVFAPQAEVTLLAQTLRTSTPADLLLQVTAECSIVTNVTTVGNDDQSAQGRIAVWIEVDGNEVPVTAGSDGDVVFCNRMYRRQTVNFDDEDATIRTFFNTRDANGFNWLALDVGSGIHTIEVKATLDASATPGAQAEAAVGNRTLVVEPTHMANDAGV